MLRYLLLTLALVSASAAVKCYFSCVAGTIEMGGADQAYPGGACTAETVEECEFGCATVYRTFKYSMEDKETKMEGSADARTRCAAWEVLTTKCVTP